jgi:hypothetical protein
MTFRLQKKQKFWYKYRVSERVGMWVSYFALKLKPRMIAGNVQHFSAWNESTLKLMRLVWRFDT